MTLSYGEFFDRLSILDVKQQKLAGAARAAVMREFLWMREIGHRYFPGNPALVNLYADLLAVNREAYEQNEVAVRGVLSSTDPNAYGHYARAVHLNKRRTELKQRINELQGSLFGEVKSYYGNDSR